MRLKGASVACTDHEQERHPARHAGRGGLGAVMGSKGLKYVAVDAGKRRITSYNVCYTKLLRAVMEELVLTR